MELLRFIIDRWRKTATLLSNCVNDYRTAEFLSSLEDILHRFNIVAIDWSQVLQTKIFKHSLGRDDVLNSFFHPVQGFKNRLTNYWSLLQDVLSPFEESFIAFSCAQGREVS